MRDIPSESTSSMTWRLRGRLPSPRTLVHLAFWSWHALWIAAVFFGIGPHLLPGLIGGSIDGEIPWGITLCALGIAVLPCLTVVAGWSLRHDHRRLFGLFYGVAGVGLTLLIVRLFFIREMTAPVALMLVTLAAGAAFFCADLFRGRPGLAPRLPATTPAAVGSMVGYSALLAIGVWIGAAMGLYCVPAIALVVQEIPAAFVAVFTGHHGPGFWVRLPLLLGLGALVACCTIVVLGLPFALVVLYSKAWWRGLAAWRTQHSMLSGLGVTAATLGLWVLGFVAINEQPQHEAFTRVEQVPADRAAQADNIAHTDDIRRGLLNAYVAPYRYWGANGDNIQLARMYRDAFGTERDVMAAQSLFNVLATPLLYQGRSLRADRQRAAIAYERFFDRPLQAGDTEAVTTAINATFDRGEAQAGLLDVGSRNVLLIEQDLRTTITDDIAQFELHEAYENQTAQRQEVFYYFSLPERAVITGLWLSAGAQPHRDFAYTVAPRGAAQAVYRQQVRQGVDPALVEQLGPRQYRLRVFPIPAPGRDNGNRVIHLWMEWTALSDGSGWPLPRLAEARNVFWDDDDTRRTIDGAPASHAGWLPARIDATAPLMAHEVVIGAHRVRAIPAAPADHDVRAVDGRLAVVVDTSLSMHEHADQVRAALHTLGRQGLAFDLYTAPSPWSADRPQRVEVTAFDPVYYGGHTHEGVLADFAAARIDQRYAAVIVMTDAGSTAFDHTVAPGTTAPPGADPAEIDAVVHTMSTLAAVGAARWDEPIWMLHFGGLPHAYRDQLAELILGTHGGVATDIDALLGRMRSAVIDGYTWSFEPSTDAPPSNGPFAALAAAAVVAHLGDRGADLDGIHAIAKQHGVVTPWSSMIVLVTDLQRKALEDASKADDRFDRETESGIENTSTPSAALEVSGTPEPHEWMLLALAALGLLGIARNRRHAGLAIG